MPISGVIEDIRLVKEPYELERLREVAVIANTAFQELIDENLIRAGRTATEVAADLEYKMRLHGAERTSFETIVASGPNSAMPHHEPGARVLEEGDIVTVDFGAHAAGYNSDTTRTVIISDADEFATEIYNIVLKAQLAGVAAAIPGAKLSDVDKACRDIITDAGYGEYFVHSTGHGVGLDLHEAPYAATSGQGELVEGMTLTVEPGIYVPGKGGVRIEDTLIITAGQPENLTHLVKDLTVV